jgi:tetratricopeptide (TPR) repeat protein
MPKQRVRKSFLILSFYIYIWSAVCPAVMAEVSISDVETAIVREDYKKAEQLARQFIGQDSRKPKSDEAQYYLGLSLLRQEKFQDARNIFEQLLRYRPSQVLKDKTRLGIVDSYFMSEQYEEALRETQELFQDSPKSEFKSLILLKLARANLKLAQWDQARDHLKKIVSQYPDSIESSLARQLLEEKQYFAVQVGAFLNRDWAEKLVGELKQKNQYAYIVETVDSSGRQFYRVRVGQVSLLNDAKNLRSELSGLGYQATIYP